MPEAEEEGRGQAAEGGGSEAEVEVGPETWGAPPSWDFRFRFRFRFRYRQQIGFRFSWIQGQEELPGAEETRGRQEEGLPRHRGRRQQRERIRI